jgi:uncharacterized protein YutD
MYLYHTIEVDSDTVNLNELKKYVTISCNSLYLYCPYRCVFIMLVSVHKHNISFADKTNSVV